MSRIDEIKARTNEATLGPWTVKPDIRPDIVCNIGGGYFGYGHIASMTKYELNQEDAEFIAHAREDIPLLLAMIDAMQETIAGLTKEVQNKSEAFEEYLKALQAQRQEFDMCIRQRDLLLTALKIYADQTNWSIWETDQGTTCPEWVGPDAGIDQPWNIAIAAIDAAGE